MPISRRDFVKQAALAPGVAATVGVRTQSPDGVPPLKIGMTDWNLGRRGDITKIELARQIGLDGIQVSLTVPTDETTPHLRDPKTQAAFKRAALETGKDLIADTRANIEYLRQTFKMPRAASTA